MRIHGWDFKTAAEEVDRVVGTCTPDLKLEERSDAAKRAAMTSLWKSARMLRPDDPAGRYLWDRCRLTHFPSCLRFASAVRSGGTENYPPMLAMVTSPDGKPSTIHRTFLTQSGTKAPIEAPRRLMPGSITKGVAVRLTAPAETLGIAEGIETALSATALTGIPCWAALNAAMLKGWQPPDLVTHVIIFADHDENFTGQAAAYALAHRLQNIDRRVTIRIPQPVGQDWNDVHRLSLSNAADGRVAASLMAAHDGTVDSLTAKGPAETFSNRQRHEYGS